MADGQGCVLPVCHFLSEDSLFWPSQHVCHTEGSVEKIPVLKSKVLRNFAESCPCTSVSMAEWNLARRKCGVCRACGVVVDTNDCHANPDDLSCSSSQLDTTSLSASAFLMETKMKTGQARSTDACSSKVSCEVESADIAHAARNGFTKEKEALGRKEHGGKTITFLCKEEDLGFPDCEERDAGIECPSTLQNGSTRLNNNELMRGMSLAAKSCTALQKLGGSCSRSENIEERQAMQRLHQRFATQVDGLARNSESYWTIIKYTPCLPTFPSAVHAEIFAAKDPEDASNLYCSSQQQPYLPGLDDEVALRCLAFVPLCGLGQLSKLCKRHRDLVKSREIFQLRRMYGTVEHLVFVYTNGPAGWTAYDVNRNVWKNLPPANVNSSFADSDKESLSAGTHLLWFGKDLFEFVYYRYDLLTNHWEKGPSMVNPRCLFASASSGDVAYVAGGFGSADQPGSLRLLNSAEMYNASTGEWEQLPSMSTPRHKCSGVFMDGKFYVIGGKDEKHQPITSGEEYDPSTQSWRTIPDMYFTPTILQRDTFEPSPPLVAVVKNQLYAVENTTNTLKIYNKHNNTWSNIGYLPVLAYLRNGWGVAFKALGDRLFVMGERDGIAACCWRPGATMTEPVWQLLSHMERGVQSFLFNCAVMTC